MTFFSCNVLNVNPSNCVSMKNQGCKIRTKIIDINNNVSSFYPYSIEINKYGARFNNIGDLYAKLCVSEVVKKIHKRQSI